MAKVRLPEGDPKNYYTDDIAELRRKLESEIGPDSQWTLIGSDNKPLKMTGRAPDEVRVIAKPTWGGMCVN